jgi:hypothetical protein
MNIAATQFSLKFRAEEIYVSGCDGFCDTINRKYINVGIDNARCHNPELWDFNIGADSRDPIFLKTLEEKIIQFDNLINYIFIFGGEPLLQNRKDLYDFLMEIFKYNKRIVLFTRFSEGERNIEDLYPLLYAVKYGHFSYELRSDDYVDCSLGFPMNLASTNQKMVVINNV